MINLDITELMAVWGKAPLKINPHQCLPLRSPKSGCRLCVENCPTKAIKLKENSIKVIDDQCTGCGICFNLCPTGVFDMTNFNSHAFAEKAQESIDRDEAIKLECCKVPFDHSTPESLRLPCLAHITPSLIMRLLSLGANEIKIRDAGICEVCESRRGDRIANDIVPKTQEILKGIGLEHRVCTYIEGISINNLILEGEGLKDYKEEPKVSRRQMFDIFKKETVKGMTGLIQGKDRCKIGKGKEGLKKAVPKERDELLKNLEGLASALQEAKECIAIKNRNIIKSHIFSTVIINPVRSLPTEKQFASNSNQLPAEGASKRANNGCNMCQLCHLFCPTDALTLKDTENGQGLVFKTASCVGCRLCVGVCPEEALTLEVKEIFLDDIVKKKEVDLIWFIKVPCTHCGSVFIKTTSEDICDICLKEKGI
ncbi:MAG: 4Fe-4S binding protein [Deltaproteobacteria bacterium]|nr:4Fe-4S binding protein [Deltaproteobacteria bacterium]